MNKQIIEILNKADNSKKQIEKCQKTKCKAQNNAGKKQLEEVQKETDILLKDLNKKKITEDQFVKKLKDISKRIENSETTKNLITCSAKECQKEFKNQLLVLLETVKYDCHVNKKQKRCDILKDLEKIITKKEIVLEDYQKIMALYKGI